MKSFWRMLLASFLVCASRGALSAPMCLSRPVIEPSFGVGFSLQSLIPNRLNDFDTGLPAYGPLVVVPMGSDYIQFQGLYGSNSGLALYILEGNYRLTVPTPFFTGFVTAGLHYLHYSFVSQNHDFGGVNVGTGFSLDVGKSYNIAVGLKSYFQQRTVLSFGGSFLYLL